LDETLGKLTAFVGARDSHLACAAAVVLAELAPRDPAIVRQLAAAVQNADAARRPFIIEALGRIGTAEAAASLVPLIKVEGPARDLALRALAHTASAALKPLLKLVGSVPPDLLERIAECAARTGEQAAFTGLFAGLANADVETCRAIRRGIRAAMSVFDGRAKENLRKQLEHAFASKPLTQHHPSLIALMKIAGDLGDTAFQSELLKRATDGFPPHVRRSALQSLAVLRLTPEQRARLAPRLLPLLAEHDLVNLAEPALEVLRPAPLGSEFHGQLRKLMNSTSARIREFAMQSLASHGTSRTLQELIECLDNPDRTVREGALNALAQSPAAAAPLCERLLELDGGDAALETARALAHQASKVPPRLMEKLAARYVALAAGDNHRKNDDPQAAQRADELRRAILQVFRAANSPALVEAVSARARKLRQDDDALRAHDLLKSVSDLNGWNDSYRVELVLAGLSAGPKDLARAARAADPNLRVLEDLLANGRLQAKDLARLVLKDPTLNRRVVYYLGFHFVERVGEERRFGQTLLEDLADGRSAEAKQAKEKLAIEGLVKVRGAQAGILEERAKVLMAAADMAAAERAREERATAAAAAAAVRKRNKPKPKPKPAAPKKKARK
jgi:hypothetical protein